MRKFTKKKGPVVAKKVVYNGITFASGLEKSMYLALQKADIKSEYEGKTYELLPSFRFDSDCYERQSNGKGEFINRGNKKVLNISYTPDFIGNDFIIECKGRANESFPMRWKMFKKYVTDNMPEKTLYKPQTQKECEQVVELILKQRLNYGR